jgi:cytochrome c-type biogenesis protein CcmH/NrfF
VNVRKLARMHRAPSIRRPFGEWVGNLEPQPASRNQSAAEVPQRFRASVWVKTVQAAVLAIAVCFSVGATDASSRFDDLGHRVTCTCGGCAQLLSECNHAGCPARAQESDELKAAIASGKSDQEIFDTFVGKYGAIVLAAPTTHGFDLVAWIAPFAVFAAALLGTILLVRRWSASKTIAAAADPSTLDPAERDRREQIRRETGDGGI